MSRATEAGIGLLAVIGIGVARLSGAGAVEVPTTESGCRAIAHDVARIRGDASVNNPEIGRLSGENGLPIRGVREGQNVDPSHPEGDQWFEVQLDGNRIGFISKTAARAEGCNR